MSNEIAPYDNYDNTIMTNNLFRRLCTLDEDDRNNNRPSRWHDITTLAKEVRAFTNSTDVAYITETGYIERDINNNNVRLTDLGRQNCNRWIR